MEIEPHLQKRAIQLSLMSSERKKNWEKVRVKKFEYV